MFKERMNIKARLALLLALLLTAAALGGVALAETEPPLPPILTVNGVDAGALSCYNADGALCLQLLPIANALGYSVIETSVSQDNMCRYVIEMTPIPEVAAADASPLMVAYTADETGPSAVAVSKDQILLPLKQNMTLVEGEPYMPCEFFVTGMCLEMVQDPDSNVLDIRPIIKQ